MSQQIFSLSSWPRAIVHIDGDAFFTSCEEAIHPELRGKALITGGERGIVACASYPAKKLGIKRGVPLAEARKICPGLIVLPSDYETYSLFSQRMFNIMRRFTPDVEEYSIDEAFADLTGMRRLLRSSYEEIVLKMKKEIERELGITVSVGLSITKVLAKIASKHQKPSGVTIIKGRDIASCLGNLPVEKIWGIGPATTNYLAKMGIRYALEFAQLPEKKVREKFTKPGVEIWQELRGESVYPVTAEEKSSYRSISKTKTFAPPTSMPTICSRTSCAIWNRRVSRPGATAWRRRKLLSFSRKTISTPSAVKSSCHAPVLFPWSFPALSVTCLINATRYRISTAPPVSFCASWNRTSRCNILFLTILCMRKKSEAFTMLPMNWGGSSANMRCIWEALIPSIRWGEAAGVIRPSVNKPG